MQGNYDIQQICENGHQITGCFNTMPEKRKIFCETCGASTINTCPHCNSEIQGHQIKSSDDWLDVRSDHHRIVIVNTAKVPSYCSSCGKPYPWTESKIATAIQILTEFGNLDEKEKETITQDINNIAKDTPQAELSANRIKRIWKKCSMAGYEIIMEFASRTAAKILKNP
jgi:hypothetical protein